MKSRIVMDVDDVISTHKNRDYENAIPNLPVIEKMQQLANEGIEFILHTARGQISCNGDLARIEMEKRPTLAKWLMKWKVPYVELRFGKPIADVYVDDAAMTPDEFINLPFGLLNGGSNKSIERLGKYVVKDIEHDNASQIAHWMRLAKSLGYNVPVVHSVTYDKIRMEYIEGTPINKLYIENVPMCTYNMIIIMLTENVHSFSLMQEHFSFDYDKYMEYLRTNIVDEESKLLVEQVGVELERYVDKITPSFCHGDYTTMNILRGERGKIYMIDPMPHEDFSTYLMDYAKLRMSLNGYNSMFYEDNTMAKQADSTMLYMLDKRLMARGLYDVVKALEATCWVRLIKYRYMDVYGYESIKKKIRSLVEDLQW